MALAYQPSSSADQSRFARLKAYRITDADRRLLRQLKGVIEPHMTRIVDAFYEHVAKFPEAVQIVTNAKTTIERLKKTNPNYFAEMFRGEFDEQYFESRRIIGEIHARVELPPEWFFASMSTYYDIIIPIITSAYKFKPSMLAAAMCAFQKAFNLDQSLITETYLSHVLNVVGQVSRESKSIGDTLRLTSQQLHVGAQESHLATSEVSNVCEQLAVAAATQAEAAQKAFRSMQNLSQNSSEMVRGVKTQNESLNKAETAAQEVQDKIGEITTQAALWQEIRQRIQAIETMSTAVKETSERVSQMDKRSAEFGRIVQTIDSIAEQTNLLALNAAIEAARAGDHGRGFAVVADEVRKLAEDSSSATKEIANLIRAVQQGTKETSASMAKTMEGVEDVKAVTGQAAACLEGIAAASTSAGKESHRLADAMSSVAKVAQENSGRLRAVEVEVQEVNGLIENIAAITEQNSASASEVSASAHEMSAQVEQFTSLTNDLDNQIAALTKLSETATHIIDKMS
jgi:methyl-accepting chemotaxis protein